MCRILGVAAREPFAIAPQLAAFAHICEHSSEYQGHGWGYSYWAEHGWVHYHDIRPIWEDPTAHDATSPLLIAHARSAFRDEGIAVENNMPFADERNVFVFNGELRGVRIKANGRIGAEKIFNYVKRFNQGDMGAALAKGTDIIEKRSRYVRAMNLIIADTTSSHLATLYNENQAYFQMYRGQEGTADIVCSKPYPGRTQWQPIGNRSILTL